MIRDEINLDLLKKTSQCVVTTKQGELDRQVSISFREGRKPYMIPDGVTAVFSACTSDGATLYNDCTVDKNKVIYDFTEGTTAAVGAYDAEIILYNGDTPLVSATFSIQVDQRASNAKKITSSDEYRQLDRLVKEGSALHKDTQKLALDISENAGSSIKKSASGKALLLTDVSPVTHVIKLTAQANKSEVSDLSTIKIHKYKKNLIPFPYAESSKTRNGVTFTVNEDSGIHIKGIPTVQTSFALIGTGKANFGKDAMNAITKDSATNGTYAMSKRLYYDSANKGLTIVLLANREVDEIIYPQVQLGTMLTDWEPFAEEIYNVSEDGTVKGVKSFYPTTTLIPDVENITLTAVYNIGTEEYVKNNEKAVEEALINADVPLSDDILKRIYRFTYYSSFFNAVNSSATGVGENTGNVGVYTDDDGVKNIVLLADLLEGQTVSITEDTILHLNGKTLSFVSGQRLNIDNNANVKFDGGIKGSKIAKILEIETDIIEHLIYVNSGTLNVNGGTYETDIHNVTVNKKSPYVFFVYNGAELNLDGVTAKITLRGGHVVPYGIRNRGTLYCNNSLINVDNYDNAVDDSDFPASYGINNDGGVAVISNTKIVCDGMRGDIGTGMYLAAGSKTEVCDCEVYGLFGGINCAGEAVIKGGKYYGVAHGGMYFSHENGITYVENAVIGSAKYSGNHKAEFDYQVSYGYTGFYIGTKSNAKAYLDNCEIIGGKEYLFVMRGTSQEENNAVYFSNCDIRVKNNRVRVDNNTFYAYFGFGNNITSQDVEAYTLDGEEVLGRLINTDEIYIKEE